MTEIEKELFEKCYRKSRELYVELQSLCMSDNILVYEIVIDLLEKLALIEQKLNRLSS